MIPTLLKALTFARRIPSMLSPTGWAVVGVLALFLAFGAYCYHRGAQGERDRQAAQVLKVERKASAGRETASDERLNDTLTTQAREKELSDAVSSLPDARPSARRVALACERLRQQGTRERDLSPACRPDGRAEAGSGS